MLPQILKTKTFFRNPGASPEEFSRLKNNEKINVAILSGSPYRQLEQLKDIDTNEVSIHPMNEADISCSVKIGSGAVFLTDKYHYDKETKTLSLFKLI